MLLQVNWDNLRNKANSQLVMEFCENTLGGPYATFTKDQFINYLTKEENWSREYAEDLLNHLFRTGSVSISSPRPRRPRAGGRRGSRPPARTIPRGRRGIEPPTRTIPRGRAYLPQE